MSYKASFILQHIERCPKCRLVLHNKPGYVCVIDDCPNIRKVDNHFETTGKLFSVYVDRACPTQELDFDKVSGWMICEDCLLKMGYDIIEIDETFATISAVQYTLSYALEDFKRRLSFVKNMQTDREDK